MMFEVAKKLFVVMALFLYFLFEQLVYASELEPLPEASQAKVWSLTEFENPASQGLISTLPRDVRIHWFFTFTPDQVVNLSSTCRLLRNDYSEALKRSQFMINQNHQLAISKLSFGVFAHPSNCVAYIERVLLALWCPKAPYDLDNMSYKQNQPPEVSALLGFIGLKPVLSKLVVKHALALDLVRDFRYLEMVACLVNEEPDLIDDLSEVVSELPESEMLVETLESNKQDSLSNLNIAFILSWCGDDDAVGYLKGFDETMSKNIYVYQSEFTSYLTEHTDLPLWSCYTLNSARLEEYCHIFRQVNLSGYYQNSLRNMGSLRDYLACKYPQLKLERVIAGCSDCIYQSFQGNVEAAIHAESQLLEGIAEGDVEHIILASDACLANVSKIEKIRSGDDRVVSVYKKLVSLLIAALSQSGAQKSELSKSEENIKLDHLINEHLAKHILCMADKPKFRMVEAYLSSLRTLDLKDGDEIRLVDNDIRSYSKEQSLHAISLALALYKGKYEDAKENLQHVTNAKPFLFIAMKHVAQDKTMPEDLAEALGELILRTIENLKAEDDSIGQLWDEDKGRYVFINHILDHEFKTKYLINHQRALQIIADLLMVK